MSEFIYRFRVYITLVLCSAASLIILNTNQNAQIEILRLKVSTAASFITRPLLFIPRTISLYADNRSLNRELFRLGQENAALREMRAENERLRAMLNFVHPTELRYIPAIVVGKSSGGLVNSITIDRGREDGVSDGFPVVSAAGLAGQVVKADKNSALCQLLLDNHFGAAVKDQRSRVDGIIHWNSGDLCRLDGIPATLEVSVGDTLVTSGLDGVYPKGINVGVVIKVRRERATLFQEIMVEPFTDFRRLEEVFILIPEKSK